MGRMIIHVGDARSVESDSSDHHYDPMLASLMSHMDISSFSLAPGGQIILSAMFIPS